MTATRAFLLLAASKLSDRLERRARLSRESAHDEWRERMRLAILSSDPGSNVGLAAPLPANYVARLCGLSVDEIAGHIDANGYADDWLSARIKDGARRRLEAAAR